MSSVDVIVGASLVEARYWKGEFSRTIPELAQAYEVSAFRRDQAYGLIVRNIYIAPGAQSGREFEEVITLLRVSQAKTGEISEPIILSSKGDL